MPSPDVARVRERLRQAAAARAVELSRLLTPNGGAGVRARDGLDVGARVFDRISGEEGIIIGRTTENVIVPTATGGDGGGRVRADSGREDRSASAG